MYIKTYRVVVIWIFMALDNVNKNIVMFLWCKLRIKAFIGWIWIIDRKKERKTKTGENKEKTRRDNTI